VLATATTRKARALAVAAVLGVLLLAPASWSVQTLGHATSSTFPAGGPAESAGFGGAPPQGMTVRLGNTPFGGGSESLSAAVAYAKANGGGTVAVASQSGAAGQLITDGADVAAIGGFSDRESQVTTGWLAEAVEDGLIRYVLTESGGGGGMRMDGRIGAGEVMAAVEEVGAEVDSVTGLYDLQGKADELRALAT
jgi:hypothetical protein